MESSLIGGKRRSIHAHPAEGPHGDAAVGLTAPRAAPALELDDLAGRLGHERLDRILVRQVVASADGVEGVKVWAVVGPEGRAGTSFGRLRVTAHRIDLGDQRDAERVGCLRGGDGSAEAGRPSSYDDDVVLQSLHAAATSDRT